MIDQEADTHRERQRERGVCREREREGASNSIDPSLRVMKVGLSVLYEAHFEVCALLPAP